MSSKYHITKYDKLVNKLLGKSLSIFLDIIMIFNQSGMIILYQVILYKLIGGIVKEIGNYNEYINIEDFSTNSFWKKFSYKFSICYGISFVILLPLCLQKDINKMRYSSTFGLYSLFFLIFIIVIECPFFIMEYDDSIKLNFYNILNGFDSNMNFLKSLSTLFYAFSCHVGAFPVIEGLKNPTKKRVNKVFKRAILLDVICYLIIGFTGYLSQPNNTPDLIIERTNLKKFKHDYVMLIGQIAFIFTLFTKICANWNACRVSVLSVLGKDSKNYSNFLNVVLTVFFLIFTTLIAVLFQSISDYISLIGSFCSVIICFVFPGLIYIKGNDFDLKHYKNVLTVVFIVLMSFFGLVSGIFTIKHIIVNN
jgi:amino acid permease